MTGNQYAESAISSILQIFYGWRMSPSPTLAKQMFQSLVLDMEETALQVFNLI